MPDYLKLYTKIFNALEDEISDLEKRLNALKATHRACEEEFMRIPEENNIYPLPFRGEE